MRIKQSIYLMYGFLFFFLFFGCSNSNENKTKTEEKLVVKTAESTDGEISLYEIRGDKILLHTEYNVANHLKSLQSNKDKHKNIWNLFAKLIPRNERKKITQFMIYEGEANGSAGFVVELSDTLDEWVMGIAIDYAFENGNLINQELLHTMIHEYGHVLTLNDSQLDPTISRETSVTYHPGEGASKTNSYINKLFNLYWKDIFELHTNATTNSTLYDFYNTHKNRFVTDYAVTNPPEDIAEVFTYFIMEKISNGEIAKKKINMLKSHSELVLLKSAIKINLPRTKRQFTNSSPFKRRACGTSIKRRMNRE